MNISKMVIIFRVIRMVRFVNMMFKWRLKVIRFSMFRIEMNWVSVRMW